MKLSRRNWGWRACLGLIGGGTAVRLLGEELSGAAPPPTADVPRDRRAKELVSGRVVLLTDALRSRGIQHYPDDLKLQVVLETKSGDLLPILPDWRGRAFHQDSRLRLRPVDLVVQRLPGLPHVQVLMVFTFDEQGTRQYTDYWCDICSIPMYEIKDCECCQGPIRLRFQPQELPDYVRPPAAPPSKTAP